MDGIYYPSHDCCKLGFRPGPPGTYSGPTAVTGHFIENRGQAIYDTLREGYPDYVTNNPPAVTLYIRVMPSISTPGKMVMYINGWERPRLNLIRGKKYQLNVSCCGYPFYFTTDSKGGQGNIGNLGNFKGYDYGVSTISIGPELPDKFYYQCTTFPDMGGQVVIKKGL